VYRAIALLFDGVAAGDKFDEEGVLIEPFVQTGFEFIQYGHGSADDGLCDFFVLHAGIFYHG
jgi:hypothetical protein